MAKNHQQLAEQILPLVGGKENIRGVCHCQTRLRFTLVDGFLQGASGSRVPIKQYLQKFPKWGRFGVTSVTPFLLRPVHPKGRTPAHRT